MLYTLIAIYLLCLVPLVVALKLDTFKHIPQVVGASIQWTIHTVVLIFLWLIGLVVIPIALLFRKEDESTRRKYTEYHQDLTWVKVSLPKIFWIWDNDIDGVEDPRGEYRSMMGGKRNFWTMYNWLAIRNPVSNLRFSNLFSVNLLQTKVKYIAGKEEGYVHDHNESGIGWQFLTADGRFGFYAVVEIPQWLQKISSGLVGKKLTVRLGHKINLFDNRDYNLSTLDNVRIEYPQWVDEYKMRAWKEFTFRPIAFKELKGTNDPKDPLGLVS